MKKLTLLLLLPYLLTAFDITTLDSDYERINPQNGKKNILLSFHDSIKDAKKAVVNISTEKKVTRQNPLLDDPYFKFFFYEFDKPSRRNNRVERSLGSGVIISDNGYIVTNHHVIDDADKIFVSIPGFDNEVEAEIIGSDKKSDIAIIKVKHKQLPYLKFADSKKIKVGDIVFAIGNPFGIGETVTQGIVSALNKSGIGINSYENFIQTDAAINVGNSGGALIDSRGALVGINTAILSRSGGSVGIGFAIPAHMVKKVALDLINIGNIQRGYLGVVIGDISKEMKSFYKNHNGALIMDIQEGSPAHKYGLKRGDLIIKVDKQPINTYAQLTNYIGFLSPNSTVKITFIRNKKELTKKIKLTSIEMMNQGEKSYEGITVEHKNDKIVIVKLDKKSKAFEKGLAPGDVILQIEDFAIDNLTSFEKAMKKYRNKKKRVYIERQGSIWIAIL